MNLSAVEKYQIASVKTKDDISQLIFIFDEVIKLLYTAQRALTDKNYELKYKSLVKIIDIMLIIRSAINPEAGEIILRLDNFYQSFVQKVHDVNINAKNPEEVNVLIDSLKQVRDSMNRE